MPSFLQRVGEGRKKTVEDIDKIAQGRVWAGADAEKIGLVDHLGGLADAVAAAAKLADLTGDYGVDYIQQELSLREQLLMQFKSGTMSLAAAAGLLPARGELERVLDPVLAQARAIARLNDPRGLYAYCWCTAAGCELQSAAQSKMILPDLPEFMISKPSM